jgi:hypothetical protein
MYFVTCFMLVLKNVEELVNTLTTVIYWNVKGLAEEGAVANGSQVLHWLLWCQRTTSTQPFTGAWPGACSR